MSFSNENRFEISKKEAQTHNMKILLQAPCYFNRDSRFVQFSLDIYYVPEKNLTKMKSNPKNNYPKF